MKTWVLPFRAVDRDKFEMIRDGQKKIETRAGSARYNDISPGDVLRFTCDGEALERGVVKVMRYPSIEAMLAEIDARAIMPWARSNNEVAAAYLSYPGYEKRIREQGILAFVLSA